MTHAVIAPASSPNITPTPSPIATPVAPVITQPLSSPSQDLGEYSINPSAKYAIGSTDYQPSSNCVISNKPQLLSSISHLRSPTAAAVSDLATQAASEKLPQVSASILRTQLQQESDPVRRKNIVLRLVTILVTEGHSEEALAILDSKEFSSDPILLFWKAQALLALGKPAEARPLLEEILSSSASQQNIEGPTRVALARAYRALGDEEKALSSLDQILPDSTIAPLVLQERCAVLLSFKKGIEVEQLLKGINAETLTQQPRLAYFLALAAWQRGDAAEALQQFNKITTGDAWLSAAVVSGIVACNVALNKTSEAQLLLEKYLQENPRSPQIAELMSQLEQLYLLENNNDINLFRKWSSDTTQPLRASYAFLPYARTLQRLGHAAKADDILLSFLKNFPNHPWADEARLLLAESKLQRSGKNSALATAVLGDIADRPTLSLSMRARYAFVRGLAEVSLKHLDLAEEDFKQAALWDPHLASEALFNQTLLASSKKSGEFNIKATLQSLLTSKQSTFSEEKVLKNVLDNNPALNVSTTPAQVLPTPFSANHEHDEYLAIFNADHGDRQSALEIIKVAPLFLKAYPKSPMATEVRMKLGEALFRIGRVREARVEFERVARAESSSELGRQALFLAAQAASRSMDPKSIDDAIMLLEQIAQNSKSGNDQWQARLEQASLKNAQALPLEAIAIYDQILASPEPQGELRYATQMAKGDTLSGLGAKDPKNYQAAIAVWRELAGDIKNLPPLSTGTAKATPTPILEISNTFCTLNFCPSSIPDPSLASTTLKAGSNTPPHWRNQALCKIGLISEKIGDNDAALAAYYEALKTPLDQEPELLWHDKAAFEAARLLEARQQWGEAIRLYQQVVAEGGARAAEAKARISKLRLENFLWEN